MEKINEELSKEITDLKEKNIDLKKALKEYIEKESTVDLANTKSIEILSTELKKINMSITELKDKTKFL